MASKENVFFGRLFMDIIYKNKVERDTEREREREREKEREREREKERD